MEVIFDYSKLRGKIKEVYRTQDAFASALGISHVSLSARLMNKIGFSQSEMLKSSELLGFPLEDTEQYFFTRIIKKT